MRTKLLIVWLGFMASVLCLWLWAEDAAARAVRAVRAGGNAPRKHDFFPINRRNAGRTRSMRGGAWQHAGRPCLASP